MNRKKTYIFIGILSALLSGCGTMADKNEAAAEIKNEIKNEIKIETEIETGTEIGTEIESETETETKTATETTELPVTETSESNTEVQKELSFEDFKNVEFYFASGAGGWRTIMSIYEDGSFAGKYTDSDMGANRYYLSDFSGKFSEPVKVNDYTYSVQISELNYEKEVGDEELKDGIQYIYSDAYGITGTKELLIYLPGAPLLELPEEYISWVKSEIMTYGEDVTELPFYGLYNVAEKCGFSSYDIVGHLYEYIKSMESLALSVEESLQSDALTQMEMNEASGQLYEIWDNVLNYEWKVLKQILDEETMNELLLKQREWISYKEQEVLELYKEYEGGSIAPLIANDKAAELTKARVYELLEYFENYNVII